MKNRFVSSERTRFQYCKYVLFSSKVCELACNCLIGSQSTFGNGKSFSIGVYCSSDKDRGEITGEIDTKRYVNSVFKFSKGCRVSLRVYFSGVASVRVV